MEERPKLVSGPEIHRFTSSQLIRKTHQNREDGRTNVFRKNPAVTAAFISFRVQGRREIVGSYSPGKKWTQNPSRGPDSVQKLGTDLGAELERYVPDNRIILARNFMSLFCCEPKSAKCGGS